MAVRTLAKGGYHTACIGKNHFGWNETSDSGVDHGFQQTTIYDGVSGFSDGSLEDPNLANSPTSYSRVHAKGSYSLCLAFVVTFLVSLKQDTCKQVTPGSYQGQTSAE